MEEENPSDAAIQVPNGHTIPELPRDVETKSTSTLPRSRRKRRSPMQIFKVALFMMRNRSQKPKPFPVNDGSRSLWNKLIGSMRPLQLQPGNDSSSFSSSPSPASSPSLQVKCKADSLDHSSPSHDTDFSDDTLFSPSAASCASASDSRYASAVGLNEMVVQTEEEEEEESKCEAGEGEGDNMIDAKAEEFIANFYQQMRLQRMNSMDYYYREIRERSLG